MVTLESSTLFSHLPPSELQRLRKVTREILVPGRRFIFKEGDPGDGVYVVKEGAVQISTIIGTGERLVFAEVLPGDVFGEMSLLDDQPRSAYAEAEGETTLYFVPRKEMVEMLEQSPELALTLVREVSERLREFNRQYIRKVLQAERMALVGRFASSIVHDLKNPLAIISMASELACADTATTASRKTGLERVSRQVERITSLVNDILEFTRGTPGKLAVTPMDYASFVTGLVHEFQAEVALKSVTIEFENRPPSIKLAINPHRLSRVFSNLILNAVDVMPNGGKVTLRFQETDTEVTTEVEDTGQGIAPEVLDHLFEAFVTFGKPRGTGLGLSISEKIVEEHGGKITARNRPGGGAVFAFTLPKP